MKLDLCYERLEDNICKSGISAPEPMLWIGT